MSTFHRVFALSLLMIVDISVGMSVPSLAECTIEYLTYHNVINTSREIRNVDECDAIIKSEINKFYDNIQESIVKGVNLEDLEDDYFRLHNVCIVKHLRDFNVSDLYLKGIAYQRLDKTHKSDHTFNHKLSSQQILLMYALQVCDPKSFYERHQEKMFSLNMRTTNEQAKCLLNHVNDNQVDEPYQFAENLESIADFDAVKCSSTIRQFIKNYYFVLDRARSFSLFNLNPSKAMQCRASNDKNLINNMILLTIHHRIRFTDEQYQREITRFYEIAAESARNFFQCILMYD